MQDYTKILQEKLDQFAFLLDSPILNIDNSPDNKNFGKINMVEPKSLAEMIFGLTAPLGKEAST